MARLRLTALFALSLLFAAPAAAQPLVADLSDHLVKITLGFEGSELLLFGAVEGSGDVVVTVYGPPEDITVRRKEKTGGIIWMNRSEMVFAKAPAFYQVMSTRPLGDWLPDVLRERHQIGPEFLSLDLAPGHDTASPEEVRLFREALIRRKQALGHYAKTENTVAMLSARLFRTGVRFPTNVPIGAYTVEVFLIENGEVISAQTTPLYISKVGILAEIFHFAHAYAALYGILAIVLAVLAGLGANTIFRKT